MFNLIWDGFLIFVGLMIGWNFLPQPDWAKRFYDKIYRWLGGS